ncbi:large neutral amino acids transporter small subunit 4-like [Mantella aurantiaca]
MGRIRRLWVLGSALVETLLFSGCLLGWNSLSPILGELGVLAHNCYSDHGLPEQKSNYTTPVYDTNYTDDLSSSSFWTDPKSRWPAEQDFCISQEQNLNLAFTLGSFFLWGSFLPLQLLLGYARVRSLRQIGGALLSVSCLMLAYSCTNPPNLSMFLPFALVAQGVGGGCVLFSSLMLPHFLPDFGAIYPSLVIASFAASATVFTIVKVLYNSGVPFVPILLGYGAISCIMFVNSFFFWNLDQTISDEGNMYRVRLRLNCYETLRKEPQKEEWCQKSLKSKFHASLRDRERILSQRRTLSFKRPESSATPSLQESLMTPTFVLHLLSDSVLLTWMYFYISSLNTQLRRVTDLHHQADLYSSMFGALQMLGLFSAPLVCFLLRNHRLRKRPGKKAGRGDARVSYRIVCSVRRLCLVYSLRTLVICCFGVTCLLSSLAIQVPAFILHTVARTSMFLVTASLYQIVFHKDHFGSLLGIHTVVTSLVTLLQHPLFLLLTGPLEGDPFWIHSVFLALSFGSFAVPICLAIRRRKKRHHVLSRPVYYHPTTTLTQPAKTTT